MRTCMGGGCGLYIKHLRYYHNHRYYYNYIVHLFENIVLFFILSTLMASSSSSAAPTDPSVAVLIRVDQSGHGDYKKIQDAIDAVPSNNTEFVYIWVKPGNYSEKIVVPADKPYITLSGKQAKDTIITWADGDHIYDSPTVSVLASNFVGRYLTFENTYGARGKGVALRVAGDKAAFYGCRMISYQDTLLDDVGRHYYKNCYIEGATDFICGNAASLFEKCHIHSVLTAENGAITAQRRETPWENTGYIFLGCKITGKGVGTADLGRPWGAHSRVIYTLSYLSNVVSPEGWNNWNDPKKESNVVYGEYKCYGPGSNRAMRVSWSKSLTNNEAAPFLSKDMIGGRAWIRPAPTKFKKGFSAHSMKHHSNRN
ncbi:putative pectinesterase 11 [Chenopodium quinoa]|uniref:putative pectinesterase 11 n=1 Tax=Chenopodium quinoa TaxID=63459 RepID=UPI000B76BD86|nr:putative pectinesterase 11 [Chenopodium quinoa]